MRTSKSAELGLPDFLILGAAKSATTSLAKYLGVLPGVFIPDYREPSFFAFEGGVPSYQSPFGWWWSKNGITELTKYRALFACASGEAMKGESSPMYLYSEAACERIRRHVPGAKLIVILRHPAERAFSNYVYNIKLNAEPLSSFGRALEAEDRRKKENWGPTHYYRDMGYYGKQLKRYFDVFPAGQIRVWLYDDVAADTGRVVGEIAGFLGVPSDAVDTSRLHNVSGAAKVSRSEILGHFFNGENAAKTVAKKLLPASIRLRMKSALWRITPKKAIKFPAGLRQEMMSDYKEDVRILENLIARDLSHWFA